MFITLSYYKSEHSEGFCNKSKQIFLCNLKNVETITTYDEYTKINMVSGKSFYVNEKDVEIFETINNI